MNNERQYVNKNKGERMKIYTASSWRNKAYSDVVALLKRQGHIVYDFRSAISTTGKSTAFDWIQIDANWEQWDIKTFVANLKHPLSINAFNSDHKGMIDSDVCLLITPSGNSSHIEAGYMKGLGKKLYIYMSELSQRPELTYSMADGIFTNLEELEDYFEVQK